MQSGIPFQIPSGKLNFWDFLTDTQQKKLHIYQISKVIWRNQNKGEVGKDKKDSSKTLVHYTNLQDKPYSILKFWFTTMYEESVYFIESGL